MLVLQKPIAFQDNRGSNPRTADNNTEKTGVIGEWNGLLPNHILRHLPIALLGNRANPYVRSAHSVYNV